MSDVAKLFQNVVSGMGNDLNCLMIGRITAYNATHNTATIEPMHYVPRQNITYNPLMEVPVSYFSLGGYRVKIKPKIGDMVLVLFSDYDIDNLLIDGKTKKGNTDRTHALEDSIALPLSINFLNNAFNATEDLTIEKEGTSTYIKIKSDGDIVLNANKIKLGENANRRVLVEGGQYGSPSNKVYGE
jgi:hypothetical protein